MLSSTPSEPPISSALHLFIAGTGIQSRALNRSSKCSSTELHSFIYLKQSFTVLPYLAS